MIIKLKKLREIVKLESYKLKLKESWDLDNVDYAKLASDMKNALEVLEPTDDDADDAITFELADRALNTLWNIADTLDSLSKSSGR